MGLGLHTFVRGVNSAVRNISLASALCQFRYRPFISWSYAVPAVCNAETPLGMISQTHLKGVVEAISTVHVLTS